MADTNKHEENNEEVHANEEDKHEENNEEVHSNEEDTGAQVAPLVKLKEVAVATGEEDEDVLIDMKAKLYRFDKNRKQWKERGVGTVKLLKHQVTKKARLLMRQSKTLKICANHLVLPSMTLQEHACSYKSWAWHATDFSDGEVKDELLAIRFASVEDAKSFKALFEEIAESQATVTEESRGSAESTAELLENLKVEVKKTESKDEKTSEAILNESEKEAIKDS